MKMMKTPLRGVKICISPQLFHIEFHSFSRGWVFLGRRQQRRRRQRRGGTVVSGVGTRNKCQVLDLFQTETRLLLEFEVSQTEKEILTEKKGKEGKPNLYGEHEAAFVTAVPNVSNRNVSFFMTK